MTPPMGPGATSDESTVDTDRILTIPNLLSMLRLLLIPVFVWLLFGPEADLWAVAVLAVSGITDYLDGIVARRTGQVSRLGQVLDPLVDRITIAVTLVALALRDVIPWWLVAALAARELLLLGLLPMLRRRGLVALPVHYLGKAATFALFWGLPFVLAGTGTATWQSVIDVVGWAFLIWGLALYWYAAALYVDQALRVRSSLSALPMSSPVQ